MSSSTESREAAIRERERQREHQKEQMELQEAFQREGQVTGSMVEEILDMDEVKESLNEFERDKVRGLLNTHLVLANFSDAEAHDRWLKLEVIKYKILGSFPPQESCIQGPVRAFLFDDASENLTALTPEQRNAIEQIIMTLQHMVTRSKGGFERKQLNTDYAATLNERPGEDDSKGRLRGLFS